VARVYLARARARLSLSLLSYFFLYQDHQFSLHKGLARDIRNNSFNWIVVRQWLSEP
jgi:hypothetical protein